MESVQQHGRRLRNPVARVRHLGVVEHGLCPPGDRPRRREPHVCEGNGRAPGRFGHGRGGLHVGSRHHARRRRNQHAEHGERLWHAFDRRRALRGLLHHADPRQGRQRRVRQHEPAGRTGALPRGLLRRDPRAGRRAHPGHGGGLHALVRPDSRRQDGNFGPFPRPVVLRLHAPAFLRRVVGRRPRTRTVERAMEPSSMEDVHGPGAAGVRLPGLPHGRRSQVRQCLHEEAEVA